MKVYLSGKVTGLSPSEYRKNFDEAAEELKVLLGNVEIVDPTKCIPTIFGSWAEYMISDLLLLKGCDAIALLPNWAESKGAQTEYAFAQGMGITIIKL
ncbi:MAG: DUF4406 domain-containing protein [Prevotella sp.]|nr:DUF4406 domain-containing protein [Candidatus Prevotella equi]